ncbi:MAG: hypothetical protein U0Q18_25490 [Bryobacteraceae bacterium]
MFFSIAYGLIIGLLTQPFPGNPFAPGGPFYQGTRNPHVVSGTRPVHRVPHR